ncbi:MAG: hypothetical protein KF901_30050 [Myxococcales bacterium]|nr:hypothetical protein [Myxococcales bacterium]
MRVRDAAWALVLACGAEAPLDLEEPRARVEAFVRFEQWAERSAGARAALGDRGAFSETLFAPLRLDREVAAARVTVGSEVFAFGALEEAPLRPLRIGTERLEGGRGGGQLVLARVSDVGGRTLRVELAFRER